jgi:hypothetical protein
MRQIVPPFLHNSSSIIPPYFILILILPMSIIPTSVYHI